MTSQEIIREKCAGLTRVLCVTSLPILTAIAFGSYMRSGAMNGWSYLVWGALQLLLYMPLISWISIWIGLRIRSPTKSIFAAMSVLLIWVALPGLAGFGATWFDLDMQFAESQYYGDQYVATWAEMIAAAGLLLIGPTSGIVINEQMTEGFAQNWAMIVIPLHVLFYSGFLLFVRSRVLKIASRRLGRSEPGMATTADLSLIHI